MRRKKRKLSKSTRFQLIKKGRKYKMDSPKTLLTLACVEKTPKDLFEQILHRRQNHNLNGPDEGGFRTILRTGFVSMEYHKEILTSVRDFLEEAYGKGRVREEELPMPLNLFGWPGPLKEADGTTGEIHSTLNSLSAYSRIANAIWQSNTTKTLYASVGTGLYLNGLLASLLEEAGTPAVESVVVWRMSELFAKKLISSGLLGQDFCTELNRNLNLIQERAKKYAGFDVDIKEWPQMSPFYGLMYGTEVLYCGHWQYEMVDKLSSFVGPMTLLTNSEPRFNKYRDLLLGKNHLNRAA